ncbi:EAL domain-containing protein [Desulfovibrio inopinatus]|uniref:EAL domain-containing protein n=1 Tax=Desulfovibrio inopinatus TaxID=102109 RepID=UPI001FE0AB96|nr:EAL domain-containing protein [Desulfovibrio inopinatus]
MILAQGYEPTVKDFIGMQQLSSLVARLQGSWLINLLQEERLTAFFQPIVQVAQPDVAYGYECLSRGIDSAGAYIAPNKLFGVAKSADLLFNLDRACRLAVIREASFHGIDKKLFINFNPTSIYKPEYCLKTTLAAIKKAGIPSEQVVFEVVESEDVGDTEHLTRILDYYRNRGFKVALDDMGAGYSSLNLLSKLKPDYMKLDIELIRHVDKDLYKAKITENLLQLARDLNVLSIAEGVETIDEWNWIKSHRADFVQGYLFAKPAPIPPAPRIL